MLILKITHFGYLCLGLLICKRQNLINLFGTHDDMTLKTIDRGIISQSSLFGIQEKSKPTSFLLERSSLLIAIAL